MSVIRCEHCGSKNVDVETNVDSSYSVKKGVLGTFLFGAFGSVMGIGGKKKEIKNYHCRECGWQSSKSLNSDECNAIDYAFLFNNTERLKELKSKYKNIEWSEPDNNVLISNISESATKAIASDDYMFLNKDEEYVIQTSIDDVPFDRREKIKRLTISKDVKKIDAYCWDNFRNLMEIIVDKDNDKYCSIDGNLYTKDETIFLRYAPGKKSTIFTIPNTVTHIGKHAFDSCLNLISIEVPNTVVSISSFAFTDCSAQIVWGKNPKIQTIEAQAFDSYNGVNIEIPNSVTSIGECAFDECENLQYNTYGNLKYLGNAENPYFALIEPINANCDNYTISKKTKIIAPCAIDGCSNVTKIIIPNSVTSIGYCAFSNCNNLTIYCEATEQPSSWDDDWNEDDLLVVWGYTGE